MLRRGNRTQVSSSRGVLTARTVRDTLSPPTLDDVPALDPPLVRRERPAAGLVESDLNLGGLWALGERGAEVEIRGGQALDDAPP